MKDKKHEWLESDFEMLFNSLSRIIETQDSIINGIVGLAKEQGLKVDVTQFIEFPKLKKEKNGKKVWETKAGKPFGKIVPREKSADKTGRKNGSN